MISVYLAPRSGALPYLIVVCIFHEVRARAYVGGVLVLGNELESKSIARGRNTVGTAVV